MTLILGALPMAAFAAWTGAIWRRRGFGETETPLRQALLIVAPLWAGWLVLGTELLGHFNAINRPLLILWWLAPFLIGVCFLLRIRRSPVQRVSNPPWKPMDSIFMAVLIFISAACGIPAFRAPPMNFDSLTYHLPRVVLWAQHHNVDHYFTNNIRQSMMSPYAEFVDLHLMVLTGSDALLNQVQWYAFLLTLAAVSLIARQLGAGRTGQILAAIFISTIPEMFLEASNTKNDVVEAMWALIAAYWALTFLDRAPGIVLRMALLGLAIGAAVLTKGTGIFFTAPTALLAVIALFRQERIKAAVPLSVMALFVIAVNAGYFSRNYRQFGNIAGPSSRAEGGYDLVNANKMPPAIASNVLRELAIEIGTPWPLLNKPMNDAINRLHEYIGIDPHDPGLTFRGSSYSGVSYNPNDEDHTGSPIHVLLVVVSLPMAFFLFRRIRFRRVLLVYSLGAAMFILFCAELRWQEWNTRLIFPVLCMLAPPLAAIWTARGIRYGSFVILLGLLACVWPTLEMNDRSLWGPGNVFMTPRIQMRFHWMPYDIPAFQQASEFIASTHPKCIAFATGGNSPDYLLMHMMLANMTPPPTFEYITPSASISSTTHLSPDIIIGKPECDTMIDPSTNRLFVAIQKNRWFSLLTPGGLNKTHIAPTTTLTH